MSLPKPATRWVYTETDRAAVSALARALGIPRVVAHLMVSRGIHAVDAARAFLDPSIDSLSDPFAMTGMDAATDRLRHAKARGEHVRIFGDYDVDGISGTAVLARALGRFGIGEVSWGMPDRLSEGYGLNPHQVQDAKAEGVRVLVTVDNGIKAHEAADTAKRIGIDLIITDHHTIEGDLPLACAVLNPKRDDPSSSFAMASGSAVAFKLGCALTGDHEDLGLAALGIVADIVPLAAENRVMAALGLAELAQSTVPGIAALAKVSGLVLEDIRAENIAFQLGPRINAGGRMGDGRAGLELLLTSDAGRARALAEFLNGANERRREIEQQIYGEAIGIVEAGFSEGQRSVVVARRGWHQGVIGIVAAKIQHALCRPVVLIAINDDGVGRASARSAPDFDLAAGLASCKDLLVRFGGHRAAAGMTIVEANIPEFAERFEAEALRAMGPGERVRDLRIDATVSLSEIDGKLLAALDRLEPFGQGNPSPVFSTHGAEVVPYSVRELRGGHLRFSVRENDRVRTAIGFHLADTVNIADFPSRIDLAFSPKFNTWQGETSIQLNLKSVRPADEA